MEQRPKLGCHFLAVIHRSHWVAQYLGSQYGLIRGLCLARWSDKEKKSVKLSDQCALGSGT